MRILTTATLFVVCVAAVAAEPRPASSSTEPVKELATLLTERHQTAIAARDPDTGGFVAALFYPGVQLLVVSATPPSPEAVAAQLAAGRFQDVYAALQDGSAEKGRLFVQDLGADGLADGGDSVDVVYDGAQQTVFDGNPRGHKMSEKAYRDAFSSADTRYAHMLSVLLTEAKRTADQR
jgi:hypothetical protein